MKTVTYEILPCVGPDSRTETGTIRSMLDFAPYRFVSEKIIPPLKVLNDFFMSGIDDGGMSGGVKWSPFSINEREYKELREAFLAEDWASLDIPNWVETSDHWHVWAMEYKCGIPSTEHLKLWDAYKEAERAEKKAFDSGTKEEKDAAFLKRIQTGTELNDFTNEYIERYRENEDNQ